MRYCSFVRGPIYLLKNVRFMTKYRKVKEVFMFFLPSSGLILEIDACYSGCLGCILVE